MEWEMMKEFLEATYDFTDIFKRLFLFLFGGQTE
jgi:hypothetical protein